MIGQTISHYKITDKLGEGGMGVVYKATDTTLDRTVALKFLAAHLCENEEGRKRFIHEAKAAAALDHPNICTVYEVNQEEGQTFIAMAYVEGLSIKQRIEQRPLKLDDALDIGIQTAQGLKAAHQKEIVHRDIKPANLMLTEGGQVKILDFGLAHFATQSKLTKTGTTLGTVAYMSPEQAQGEAVDRRADIWSLGIVLYEMVTGQLPFKGDYEQVVAYNILNEEPEPITALRAGMPMELEWIVGKTLAKDREERYQHVEDMIVDLRGLDKKLKSGKSTVLRPQPPPAPSQAPSEELVPKRKLRFQQALFAITAVALLALAFVHFGEVPGKEAALTRFAFAPGHHVWSPVISPNGRHIAYAAFAPGGAKLWVQDLDQEQPRELGPRDVRHMFWSPDSKFIGFHLFGTRELKKISVHGGVATTLCGELPSGTFWGGTWSPDGDSIVLNVGNRLYQVPSRGGKPSLLIEPEESEKTRRLIHGSVQFLPLEDRRRILLFSAGGERDQQIRLRNLETGEQEVLGNGLGAVYSPSGHILYQIDDLSLWALPFSIERLKPTGEAFRVAQNVERPSVAANGTLIYRDGTGLAGELQLVWRDRRGKKLGVIGQPQRRVFDPVLSPDGLLVAAVGREKRNLDIWIHDASRPITTRLTFDGAVDTNPVWSPAGDHVAFSSDRQGNEDIFVKPADGSAEAKTLVATRWPERVSDWSSDGRYILYHQTAAETGHDLWYLERKDDNSGYEPVPFLQTPFRELAATLSPDGRFVAYVSDESGGYEVYVQRFPGGGGKRRVSSDGGGQPRWCKEGKELFYVVDLTLLAVSVTTRPDLSMGPPRRLFESAGLDSPRAPG